MSSSSVPSPSYKKLDQLQRFLFSFWRNIPGFLISGSLESHAKNFKLNVLFPFILSSNKGVCDLIDKLLIPGKKTAGGFNEVGPFKIYENGEQREMLAITVSFGPSTSPFVPYMMDVILKKGILPKDANVNLENVPGMGLCLVGTDLVHDALVSSLVSHIFDLGVCPFFPKYFTSYFCPTQVENKYQNFAILEKIDFGMSDFLSRFKYSPQLTFPLLRNILIQVMIGALYMKRYFGISHFDLHPGNLLFDYLNDSQVKLPIQPKTEYIYAGTDITKVPYFAFEIKENDYLVIENMGILTKIIDYGITVAELGLSEFPQYKYGLTLLNSGDEYNRINGLKHAFKTRHFGDEEWNYIVMCILYSLKYSKDVNGPDPVVKPVDPHHASLLQDIIPFILSVQPNLRQIILNENLPVEITRSGQRQKLGGVNPVLPRGFGTTSDPYFLVYNLMRTLMSAKAFTKVGEITYYNATEKNLDFTDSAFVSSKIKMFSFFNAVNSRVMFAEFSKEFNRYYKGCMSSPSSPESVYKAEELPSVGTAEEKCIYAYQNIVSKLDLSNYVQPSFFENVAGGDLVRSGTFLQLSGPSSFPDKYAKFHDGFTTLFSMYIYPGELNLKMITSVEELKYKDYHRLNNYKSPPISLLGKQFPGVNIHVLGINKQATVKTQFLVHKHRNHGLYSTMIQTFNLGKRGFMVNGSYFVVSSLLGNMTVYNLDKAELLYPIGFYFNADEALEEGTCMKLPIPSPYVPFFAFITIAKDGKFTFRKYSNLLLTHETKDVEIMDGGNLIRIDKMVECSVDGLPLLKEVNGDVRELNPDTDYKYGFSTGPILVWEGNVVFTQRIMNRQMFTHKVYPKAATNTAFLSSEGEKAFPYGQRHSNNLMPHLVLIEFKDGTVGFLMVEGRGFDAPGVDRAQLAEMCVFLGAKHAVSLDGGFSANAVINMYGLPKIMVDIPENRPLGFMISVSEK